MKRVVIDVLFDFQKMNKTNDKQIERAFKTYLDLTKKLKDPNIIKQIDVYTDLARKIKPLIPGGKLIEQKNNLLETIAEWKQLAKKDPQLKIDAEKEQIKIQNQIVKIDQKIQKWWDEYQNPPTDNKSTIMELRSASGGAEASLFVGDVLQMYLTYFKKNKWKYRFFEQRQNESGGYNYVVLSIDNSQAYNNLQYEAGVHRVQRVPKTETQGRVHTSTITVAVLKKMAENEFPLALKDLRIDTFRSSGAGGQSVNTTDSAVRIVHIPTGLTVSCQDGRSQHDNKERALEVLRARLYKMQQEKIASENLQMRKEQIGTGIRSEKIRTYNYPQNRITDHRIKTNFSGIEQIMNGNLDKIIKKLQTK